MSFNNNSDGIKPYAVARLVSSSLAPNVAGVVKFYNAQGGTRVTAEVFGLPDIAPATGSTPQIGPFGFHIHEGTSCEPRGGSEPFSQTGGHYNPTNQPHPLHAGDLPSLFPNRPYTYMSVLPTASARGT